jgi:hypothetical protein
MTKSDQLKLASLYMENFEEQSSNLSSEWTSLMSELENIGFTIHTPRQTTVPYAEYYKWNQWTIQARCENPVETEDGFDCDKFVIEIYYDNENLSYKDKTIEVNTLQELKSMLKKVLNAMNVEIESELYL